MSIPGIHQQAVLLDSGQSGRHVFLVWCAVGNAILYADAQTGRALLPAVGMFS